MNQWRTPPPLLARETRDRRLSEERQNRSRIKRNDHSARKGLPSQPRPVYSCRVRILVVSDVRVRRYAICATSFNVPSRLLPVLLSFTVVRRARCDWIIFLLEKISPSFLSLPPPPLAPPREEGGGEWKVGESERFPATERCFSRRRFGRRTSLCLLYMIHQA